MILSEILTRLARGELQNLSIVDPETRVIRDQAVSTVVGYINEALLRLHSRFVLREDDVLVEMFEQITTYELKPRFAVSHELADGEADVPHRYIMDLGPKKFAGDVIRVTQVFNSFGDELELNNPMAPASVFTPRPKVIQVPMPVAGEALSVVYQARHPILTPGTGLDAEVELPDVLEGALLAYVGYQAFGFMGGQDNIAKADVYMSSYNNICVEMEEKDGMGTSTRARSDAFEMKGWI